MAGITSENRARFWAAIGTAIIMGLSLLLLMVTHLSVSTTHLAKADNEAAITLDEEFIEVMPMPAAPQMTGKEPARATADEQMQSQPTPESGIDIKNQGKAGEATKINTVKEESPMKVQEKKTEPQKQGATVDNKKKEEDAIKRKADNEVTNAFSKSEGKHNNAKGNTDQGNYGVKTGNAPSGTLTGRGTGTAGGGWGLPAYGAVTSTVTGSVKMAVTIDRNGNVVGLTFEGGEAPAATNTAVRNACAAEVRSRKFTRSNPDTAPETSRAYITYTFR